MTRDADALRRELGVGPKPKFLEGPAPRAVDDNLIRALHEGGLSAEDDAEVEDLITCFEDWHQADRRILQELASDQVGSMRQAVGQELPRPVDRGHRDGEASGIGWSWRQWSVLATAASLLIAAGVTWIVTRDGDGRVVARFDDPFGRVVKTDRGEIRGLQTFPEQWRAAVEKMIRTETVEVSGKEIDSLHVTRGSSNRTYVRPVGEVVREERPTFEWKSLGDGAVYQVLVYEWGEEEPVIWSDVVKALRWQSDRALQRGREFAWELRASSVSDEDKSRKDRALFRVIDVKKLAEVESQEREARGSHLVLAAIYLRAGLLDDARRELEALNQEQGKSALVDKLLATLAEHR